MKKWLFMLLILCGAIVSTLCVHNLYRIHKEKRTEEISAIARLPPSLARSLVLEFQGVTADYLMLKTLTFHGEKLIREEEITPSDWKMTLRAIQQIVNLDPRFWDPYVLAEMSLPWDANMVLETNNLLLRAAEYRLNDYRPYFYLWFNYFYFLNDPGRAAPYLEKSSRKPGAPQYFATLAARMHFYAGQTQSGILFLKEMISQTNDPAFKKNMQKRLDALKVLLLLERKVEEYKKRFNETPKNLQELIEQGLLPEIPPDPYGGRFIITQNGKVYTTSKLTQSDKKEK